MNDEYYIKTTSNWIKNVVIQHNFCPFAAQPWQDRTIRYVVVREIEIELLLETVINECLTLDNRPEIETTLVILPDQFPSFEDYLDLVELSQALLTQQNYEGIFQIASFHPEYQFENSKSDDPANYTNRSPYPMLHLLREESVERAIMHYKNPELIPEKNIALTRAIGLEKMKEMREKTFGNDE